MAHLSAFNTAASKAVESSSVKISSEDIEGTVNLSEFDELPCKETKEGGKDCTSSIQIGAIVRGNPGRGRGRGGRGSPTVPRDAPVSRFAHPRREASAQRQSRFPSGSGRIISDGFVIGEFLIGGTKYTKFVAISGDPSCSIVRIRPSQTSSDIAVVAQTKQIIVFFNDQGESLVKTVPVVHSNGDAPRPQRGNSSAPRPQRAGSSAPRGRPDTPSSSAQPRDKSVSCVVSAF